MSSHKIIEELKKYVSGSSSEKDLEQWVLSNYQLILDSGEESAVMLANEINALFVEQSEDLVSKEEMQYAFEEILRREESTVYSHLGQSPVRIAAVNSVRKRLRTAGQITNVRLTFQGV
jgi:hypothetical protein